MVDGRRDVVAIGAGAEEEGNRPRRDVAPGHARQPPLDLDLAQTIRQIERRGEPLGGGNVGEQGVDVRRADARQHLGAVNGVKRQIAHRGSRESLEECGIVGLAQQRSELARARRA